MPELGRSHAPFGAAYRGPILLLVDLGTVALFRIVAHLQLAALRRYLDSVDRAFHGVRLRAFRLDVGAIQEWAVA